jgi:serine/threonine-protein kinase
MAKKCTVCLTEWPEDMQFCPHDGTPLTHTTEESSWDELLSSSPRAPQKTLLPCQVGDVLGNYRLVEHLGEGGMASVFRATHKLLGREVAVKVLQPELAQHAEAIQRFFKEGQAVNRIQHPAIVDITDFVQSEDHPPYIVMELLSGESLSEHIQQNAPIAPDRTIELILPLCSALQAMHDIGIVHRDLKPDNVFLVKDKNEEWTPKLIDFGIAKFMATAEAFLKTRTGQLIGTPEYMAPELIRGKKVDSRIDIYAMGIMIYEMLTGKPPFQGSLNNLLLHHLNDIPAPPSQNVTHHTVPPALDEAVMHCLEKKPAARVQTMNQLTEILEWTVEDEHTSVVVLSDIPAKPRRRWLWISAAVTAAVCAAGVLIWLFVFGKTKPTKPKAAAALDTKVLHHWLAAARAQKKPQPPKSFALRSSPSGGAVFRLSDGKYMGRTPLSIKMVNGEKDTFLIRAKAHKEHRVALSYTSVGPIHVSLIKKRAPQNDGGVADDGGGQIGDKSPKTIADQRASGKKHRRRRKKKSSRRPRTRTQQRTRRTVDSKTSTVNPFE